MDKVSKLFAKLGEKDSLKINEAIKKIKSGDIKSLNVRKLKGNEYIFRVRVGKYRIIYLDKRVGFGDSVEILDISKRSDGTYKKF
jgi:mRNA-degrading endonuclease RelE of RelBE toxin-antitoxin system